MTNLILERVEPALDAHIIKHNGEEPDEKRRQVAWNAYDLVTARRVDRTQDAAFVERMRGRLSSGTLA